MQSSSYTFSKISIVTPSFNQGQYIEQTIRSVLDQNYPNLEYIIIDGGSTDGTIDIIKKYESKLTYWISEPDKGQTDAINKGFAKCTGDIFNWLNSDDYYEPETFFKLASFFNNFPSVNVVCGKEWGFNDINVFDKILHRGSIIGKHVFETIRIGIIDQPCTFFRKKCITHFFPLDSSLRYVMDRQLWWSYLLQYGQDDILITNEIFANFRLHSQSKSISEADVFEEEFDRLKLTLFKQLNAPDILLKQLHDNVSLLNRKWKIDIGPNEYIQAAFAVWYAERHYVKEDLPSVSKLMRFVKKWKRNNLDYKEWKLWMLSIVIPYTLVKAVKKIKNKL